MTAELGTASEVSCVWSSAGQNHLIVVRLPGRGAGGPYHRSGGSAFSGLFGRVRDGLGGGRTIRDEAERPFRDQLRRQRLRGAGSRDVGCRRCRRGRHRCGNGRAGARHGCGNGRAGARHGCGSGAALERAHRSPGTVFRDCDACLEMVAVPPGSFMMGSPASEAGRLDNEGSAAQGDDQLSLGGGRVRGDVRGVGHVRACRRVRMRKIPAGG